MTNNNAHEDIIINKLYKQIEHEYQIDIYNKIIKPLILSELPTYYIGGPKEVLKTSIKRYGGCLNVKFRLGYAGFSSSHNDENSFYISFDYYDSKLGIIDDLSTPKESLILENKDALEIATKLAEKNKGVNKITNPSFIKKLKGDKIWQTGAVITLP